MEDSNSSVRGPIDMSEMGKLMGQPPALPPRQTNRLCSQILSSDEAPDTGDESDEDLITSYLNEGSNDNFRTLATDDSPPILEDTLSHLTQIRDRIQQMRIENAEAAMNFIDPRTQFSPNFFLSPGQHNRLSSSCPSLNNSVMDNATATSNNNVLNGQNNNGIQSLGMNAFEDRQKSDTNSKERIQMPQGKTANRKRYQHVHRQRSVSVSSGDSDIDTVDGLTLPIAKARQRSCSSHGLNHHATTRSRTAPIRSLVCNNSEQHGHGKLVGAAASSSSSGASDRVCRSCIRSDKPAAKNNVVPHLSTHFGHTLQKSVSTPSIVIENYGDPRSRKATIDCPEPTNVFLQQLMSNHDWMRKGKGSGEDDGSAGGGGGSDSDNLSLPLDAEGYRHKQGSEPGSVAAHASGASSSAASFNQFTNLHIRTPVSCRITSATPSPQLSLAEFLRNDPTLLEDDDSRKRRRKKERSSLFFRKKKDKSGGGGKCTFGSSGAPLIGPPLFDQPLERGPISTGGSSGLSKVSSSANLGSGSFSSGQSASQAGSGGSVKGAASNHSRFPQQHSYSMSSLRKGTGGAGGHNLAYLNSTASTFYVARGELSKTHDDREEFGHEGDTVGLIEGEFVPGEEFPEGGPAAIKDLDTPPFLRIQEVEAETWQQTVRPDNLRGLLPVDIKHQEHIYEVIITESNHCQVLKVIEKIFVEGMYKYLNLSKDVVDRIFPCVDIMIDIHLSFLEELRIRQNEQPVVSTISDILHRQFSGSSAVRWREAYGTFCSSHNEAISVFKDLMKSDRRFQQFIRQCSENPLLKKKGVPECILFVTTRITKYPLLIDALIKTAKDRPAEEEELRQAKLFVRQILKDVNSKVAEKERKARLLEIYSKLDAKSAIVHMGKKFKKSELLSAHRRLMFEGTGTLTQARNRSVFVSILVLSDIVIFLQENNQKYFFITPEHKPSILPVRGLIAQEGKGHGSGPKSLVILSTVSARNTASFSPFTRQPDRFEIEIHQPPARDDWILGITEAVDACPPGSDGETVSSDEEIRRGSVESRHLKIKRLIARMKAKDVELARLLEDKMKSMGQLVRLVSEGQDASDGNRASSRELPHIDYVNIAKSPMESELLTQENFMNVLQEASRWATSLYSGGGNLSRSTSSVGERHSQDFATPALPKRAETFSEFDQSMSKKMAVQEINLMSGDTDEAEFVTDCQPNSDAAAVKPTPSQQPTLDSLQQKAAYEIVHRLNGLTCLTSKHFTVLEMMNAELAEIRDKSRLAGGRYAQNQQFEELRVEQEALIKQKASWQLEREKQGKELEAKRTEQQKIQTELERISKDVKEQREQFFRQLDVLRKNHGIELGPNMVILKSDPTPGTVLHQDAMFHADHADCLERAASRSPQTPSGLTVANVGVRKTSSMSGVSSLGSSSSSHGNTIATGGSLKKDSFANLNLLSATNETKQVGLDKQEIKQQIPVKLSSKLSVSTRAASSSASTSALSSIGPHVPSVADKAQRRGSAHAPMLAGSVSGSSILPATNLAKSETVQQLLPFKLSESASQQAQLSPGKHKSNASPFGDLTGRFSQPPTFPGGTAHGHYSHYQHPDPSIASQQQQRTGSQTHLGGPLVNVLQPQQQGHQQNMSNMHPNTLPKKDTGVRKATHGEQGGDRNTVDDNVVYFF